MNILTDQLPRTVNVCGKDRRIYTDFREYIELDTIVNNGDDEQAALYVLSLFADEVYPDECIEAFNALFNFIYPENDNQSGGKAGGKSPVFSFYEDSVYILSDFRRYYGIDLIHIEYMHWYEFMALLNGLPDDSSTKTRIAYRSMNLADIKDKKERARYRKIKNALRIGKGKQKYLSDYDIGEAFS